MLAVEAFEQNYHSVTSWTLNFSGNKAEIPVPVIKAKRPNAFKAHRGELSTKLDANICVLPSGTVRVYERVKQNSRKNVEEIDSDVETEDLTTVNDETKQKKKNKEVAGKRSHLKRKVTENGDNEEVEEPVEIKLKKPRKAAKVCISPKINKTNKKALNASPKGPVVKKIKKSKSPITSDTNKGNQRVKKVQITRNNTTSSDVSSGEKKTKKKNKPKLDVIGPRTSATNIKQKYSPVKENFNKEIKKNMKQNKSQNSPTNNKQKKTKKSN